MMQNPHRNEPTIGDSGGKPAGDSGTFKADLRSEESVAEPLLQLADMAPLYQRIKAACPTDKGCVIAVLSPHPKAGVTSVAHGIARAAAELSSQRVLLCDATGTGDLFRFSPVVMRRSLEVLAAYERFSIPVGLVACSLDNQATQHQMIAGISRYSEALDKFRNVFDLIVIDTPASNVSDLGPALSRHVDAVVIVVEADKTRAPLVQSLIGAVEGSGGNVAGLVLNKRRQYIPEFIYRWF